MIKIESSDAKRALTNFTDNFNLHFRLAARTKPRKFIKGEIYWLEEIDGEWFICVPRRHRGKKEIVKVSVKETNQKIEAAK